MRKKGGRPVWIGEDRVRSSAEAVERATGALQRVNDVKSSDGFAENI